MIVNYRLKKQRIDPLDESVLEWLRDTRRGRQTQERANGAFERWQALLQQCTRNIWFVIWGRRLSVKGVLVIELFISTVKMLTDAMRHELLRTKKRFYMFDKLDQKIIISKTRKMCKGTEAIYQLNDQHAQKQLEALPKAIDDVPKRKLCITWRSGLIDKPNPVRTQAHYALKSCAGIPPPCNKYC